MPEEGQDEQIRHLPQGDTGWNPLALIRRPLAKEFSYFGSNLTSQPNRFSRVQYSPWLWIKTNIIRSSHLCPLNKNTFLLLCCSIRPSLKNAGVNSTTTWDRVSDWYAFKGTRLYSLLITGTRLYSLLINWTAVNNYITIHAFIFVNAIRCRPCSSMLTASSW